MRITVQRTGGFAGVPMNKALDIASMPDPEASKCRQMIDAANFFQLPGTIVAKPQPDRYQYDITIELDGKKHRVTVPENAMPANLQPLLNWIMQAK